jgi:two-component system chemotaxis response regulator CheB
LTVGPAASQPGLLRLLLVDDSASYRLALALLLGRDKAVRIVGEAADGQTALLLAEKLHPDVVLMDVMMPKMDGIETARIMLRTLPSAVVLMSIIVRYPEQRAALEKLPQGGLDLTDKPLLVGPTAEANIAALLLRLRAAVASRRQRRHSGVVLAPPPTTTQLIAVAASTGGMEAIQHALCRLPPSFPPVVIAQHVGLEFAERFAPLLEKGLNRTVVAVDGLVPLLPNRLYVAAHHHHLQVDSGRVGSQNAAAAELAPNADHLFFSVAKWYGEQAVGVILTGMGHDGALGLLAMRDAGSWTIGQDDGSALVYGMPRAAVELGACREVLALTAIRDRLAALGYGGPPAAPPSAPPVGRR